MKKTSTYRVSTYKICIVAFAICINLVGGQIALFLKLPIYLDSIGTVFIASTLGPIYGMLPNVISGLFMGMTVDVYSLYYAPVGIILGLVTGLVYRKYKPKKMVDICGSAGNYITVNHCKFLHYGILIWRDYIIRFYGSGAASCQNPDGNGRSMLCGSVLYRLY